MTLGVYPGALVRRPGSVVGHRCGAVRTRRERALDTPLCVSRTFEWPAATKCCASVLSDLNRAPRATAASAVLSGVGSKAGMRRIVVRFIGAQVPSARAATSDS